MTDLMTIDLDEERAAVGRLFADWQKELAAKVEAVEFSHVNRVSPGDHYWEAEAKARARWVVASNFVQLLEQARRR